MSRSETAALAPRDSVALAETVSEFVESALNHSGAVDIDVRDVRTLVSSVTRLYAACCDSAGQELPAIDATVSTTDAVMLACALLRAHSLNPFDLALWFSRVGVGRPGEAQPDGLGAAS